MLVASGVAFLLGFLACLTLQFMGTLRVSRIGAIKHRELQIGSTLRLTMENDSPDHGFSHWEFYILGECDGLCQIRYDQGLIAVPSILLETRPQLETEPTDGTLVRRSCTGRR